MAAAAAATTARGDPTPEYACACHRRERAEPGASADEFQVACDDAGARSMAGYTWAWSFFFFQGKEKWLN